MKKNKEKPSFKTKIVKIFIFIILISSLLYMYSRYVEPNKLTVREYRIESNILTNNFNGLKIVHFSDLLYGSTVNKDSVKLLVEKINKLKPDIVVFTGDLINKGYKLTDNDFEELNNNLSLINASIGKYAIYGDNDYTNDNYKKIMEESKFIILDNSYEEVFYKTNNSFYLVGLSTTIKSNPDIDKAFEFYKDEDRKYIIVLVHDGNTIKLLDKSNYETDLILGGHSLNGQINLPFIGPIFKDKYFYKYYDKEYEKGITKIFISGGIGTGKYKIRLNNSPSINLYRLKAQS